MRFDSGHTAEPHPITPGTFAGEMGFPEADLVPAEIPDQPAPDLPEENETSDSSQGYSAVGDILIYCVPCCLCLSGLVVLAGAGILLFRKRGRRPY